LHSTPSAWKMICQLIRLLSKFNAQTFALQSTKKEGNSETENGITLQNYNKTSF